MKIKDGFMLRKLGSQFVVIALGEASKSFNGIVRMNGTGAFLFELLQTGTDLEGMIQRLVEDYDIDRATAATDAAAFVERFQAAGLLIN